MLVGKIKLCNLKYELRVLGACLFKVSSFRNLKSCYQEKSIYFGDNDNHHDGNLDGIDWKIL